MRVLYVEGAFGFGGSLTGILRVIRNLPPEIEPMLVTRYDPRSFTDIPADLPHKILPIPNAPPSRFGILGNLWRFTRYNLVPWGSELGKVIRRFRPHLLHANNSSFENLAVGLVGRRWRIPTISHEKDFQYTGRLNQWVLQSRVFSHHLATSESVAKHLLSLKCPPDRLTTIYDPVIPPPEDCVRTTHSGNPFVLAMHSMLMEWKGQHVFLDAVAQLRRRSNVPVKVVIAGTAPGNETEYPARLRRQVDELDLIDIVEFVGHVRDVYRFLSGVNISVHASVTPEPLGTVVIEALLCGVPVIATNAGGPADYLHDSETGLLVPPNDPEAMVNALERLVNSEDLRNRLGTAGRKDALHKFHPQLVSERFVQLYRRIIERTRTRT